MVSQIFWGGTYDDPKVEIIEYFSDLGIDIKKYLGEIDNLIPRFIFSNDPVNLKKHSCLILFYNQRL